MGVETPHSQEPHETTRTEPDALKQQGAGLPDRPRELSLLRRLVFFLCGVALSVGFFLPWVTAGTALELSGLGLVFSGGEVVQAISGSGRFLLFIVPLLGGTLIAGAVMAGRWTAWVAALGAGALLLFGIIHVIFLFMSSTGLGMWLVVFAALSTLIFGALTIGTRKPRD